MENNAANDIAAVQHQTRSEFTARIDVVNVRLIHRLSDQARSNAHDRAVSHVIQRHTRIDRFAVPLSSRVFAGENLDTELIDIAEFTKCVDNLAARERRIVVHGKGRLRQLGLNVAEIALRRFSGILGRNKQDNGQGKSSRRLAINWLADLSHHRTYGSVYGGSKSLLPYRQIVF